MLYLLWPVNVGVAAGVRDLPEDQLGLIDPPPARIAALLCFVHVVSVLVWPGGACAFVCFMYLSLCRVAVLVSVAYMLYKFWPVNVVASAGVEFEIFLKINLA